MGRSFEYIYQSNLSLSRSLQPFENSRFLTLGFIAPALVVVYTAIRRRNIKNRMCVHTFTADRRTDVLLHFVRNPHARARIL